MCLVTFHHLDYSYKLWIRVLTNISLLFISLEQTVWVEADEENTLIPKQNLFAWSDERWGLFRTIDIPGEKEKQSEQTEGVREGMALVR